MPELSRFFGIVIAMYWRDHNPPHFHAFYGQEEALLTMDGEVLSGSLSRRALALVREWLVLHRQELLDNWERAQARLPLEPIEPLE